MRLESFLTPGLVDAIVVAVALEFVAVSALLVQARAARLVAPLFLYLASGAFLLLALRASLAGAEATWIALALAASGLAHVGSLRQAHRALFRAPPQPLGGRA